MFARKDTAEMLLSSQIRGERSSIFDLARGRLSLLATGFVLLYLIVGARVVDLAVVQGALLKIKEDGIVESVPAPLPLRADITDRNGMLLATTIRTKSLFTDASYIEDPQGVLQSLLKIFPDLPQKETLEKLSSGKRFAWIVRDLTPAQEQAVLMIGEPGLGFQEEARRIYPQGDLAAHLIGYTDVDGKGLSGLERSYNDLLGQQGSAIKTTLDIRLQFALQKELLAAKEAFQARSATGIIMDIQNGDILAGGSVPHFNPNHLGRASDDDKFNRLTLGVYELGSVFKIFSTAALLNEGASLSRLFDARQPLRYGRFSIRDYHAEKRIMSVPEVFMHSSNIGTALMGEALGTDRLKAYYKALGLLDAPDFAIREVGRPLVPSPWREINTLTASYGHGIAVSPLQLASAVATTVGDGTVVSPRLVMETEEVSPIKRRVFQLDTVEKMRQLLRLNAVEGTGTKGLVKGYLVGGKTGTAEKPGPRGGYEGDKMISSFVSVFPANDPRYLVFVLVDEPVGNKSTYGYATGGWVAAPATARIIEHMVRIYGLKPYDSAGEESMEFVEPLLQYLPQDDKVAHAN
ncbi:MAG: penicillin-binding protein 2 [Rhodospirillales bacterium]|nr:penicillin-binding protein 2 [Rhodospirillales bacterium]MCB9979719.1 penicillin-binding protein 2 [Rhodospirillales bacterium]